MHTRRRVLATAATLALAGCGEGGGDTATPPGEQPPTVGSLAVSTPAFDDGAAIPDRHTGVGEDVSPPLRVQGVPDAARTLAVVVDDPDAADFVHWLLWNVPADVGTVPEAVPQTGTVPSLDGARQGTNDFDEVGYRGPFPPPEDGPHAYRFTVSAVDATVDTEAGAGRDALETALDGHVVASGELTGVFER